MLAFKLRQLTVATRPSFACSRASDTPATYGALQMCFDWLIITVWMYRPDMSIIKHCCTYCMWFCGILLCRGCCQEAALQADVRMKTSVEIPLRAVEIKAFCLQTLKTLSVNATPVVHHHRQAVQQRRHQREALQTPTSRMKCQYFMLMFYFFLKSVVIGSSLH